MGRPAKPEILKERDGDAKCRRNPDAPVSPEGFGPPPDHLEGLARLAWERLAALLDAMKLSHRADADALEIYATNYQIWRTANKRIADEGYLIDTGHTVKAHPCFPIANEAQRTMGRILGQFGLTPAARAGLRIEAPDDDDELLTLMARGRGQDEE